MKNKRKNNKKISKSRRKKNNINYFFNPDSVAVIGASTDRKKIGNIVLRNLMRSKYKGRIYAVNPHHKKIEGKKSYPDIKDINKRVEMAVIAVPSEKVLKVVEDCNKKKVKACVILSGGFGEIGKKKDEEKIKKAAGKMRILGPNVFGVYDSYSGIDTMFTDVSRQKRPPQGSIAILSHSGAFGIAILNWAVTAGVGLSKFVSLGNRIDVDECDMLEYLLKDKHTKTIGIFFEGSVKSHKFFKMLKKSVKRKPVVILKAGKTEAGEKAVRSHTGRLATGSRIYSGMFRQCGAVEANNAAELFDFTKVLDAQPVMKGNKVQIVTDGGGFGILAADRIEGNGLELAKLDIREKNRVKKYTKTYASTDNPLDLTGSADINTYKNVLDIVMSSKKNDALLIIFILELSMLGPKLIDVVIKLKHYRKPMVVCATTSKFSEKYIKKLEKNDIPVYSTPERAADALKALHDYLRWQ